MELDKDLAAYCERVLGRLNMTASRSTGGPSDAIQVFVNERRIGLLGRRETESTIQFQRQGCVDHIQLRSEDGVLIGSLSAPECGFRAVRIPLSEGTVELRIQNTAEGGSARAVFTPAPRRWSGLLRTIAESVQAMALRPATAVTAPRMRIVVVTQVLLAAIVLGLAADRITDWMTLESPPLSVTRAEVPWVATQTEVAKLESQLGNLARMQAKTSDMLQSQQQGMAQLQLAIAKLSSSQRDGEAGISTAWRKMEHLEEGRGQDIPQTPRELMGKPLMDHGQLKDEIHNLTVENARLSKEMAELAEQNQDLEKMLKSSRLEVSEATVTDHDHSMTVPQPDAQQLTSMLPLAEAGGHAQPFLFWVNFSEGTTQESIDQWVHDMHGHRVAVNGGWQEVEVTRPSMPTDRFLEQVRGAKIVKAVRVSP